MPATTHDTAELRLGTVLPTRELTILGEADPHGVLDLGRRLDRDGVDSLWVGESVIARPRIDALTVLAGLAAVTRRATIGSAVVLPVLRHPAVFAHQVASLDRLASGRLVLGVGAGFPGPDSRRELEVLGADYHRRVQALDAAVGTMRELWAAAARPGGVSDGVTILPPPVRPAGPAIWLAAGTPPGLDRCARTYDGWLPYPVTADDYAAGWQTIRGRANAAGRPPDAVEPALYVTVAVGEGSAPHDRLDAYCRAYYGAPSELVGTVQALASGARTRWRGACGATSRPAAATW